MKRIPLPMWLTAVLLYGFLYAPIAVVIVYSFNAARFGVNWGGVTLQWYRSLTENPVAMDAAKNTFLLATISTGVAVLVGTLLGYSLSRHRFRGKGVVSHLMYVPVFVPDIVLAVGLLLLYSTLRNWLGLLDLGLTTMVLAHVTFQIPFVAIVVRARMSGLDPALEEAARDLGANDWRTFSNITLPLIMPGIIGGGMLAFTLSIDDFVVSFFTCGPGSTTLPILIYSSVKRGINPEIHALSTLIILTSFLGTLGLFWLQRATATSKE